MPAQLPVKHDQRGSADLERRSNEADPEADKDSTVVDVELLAPIPEEKRVFLEWNHVSAFVPGTFIPGNTLLEATKTMKRVMTFSKPDNSKSGPPPKRQVRIRDCVTVTD